MFLSQQISMDVSHVLQRGSHDNKQEVLLKSHTKEYFAVFAQLLPAGPVPWCRWIMLVAAVMVSQTLGLKFSCRAPLTYSHLTGYDVRYVVAGLTLLFPHFLTVSASSRIYFCSSSPISLLQTSLNILFYERNTTNSPSWLLFGEPNEVPTRPGRDPSVHITPLHIHQHPTDSLLSQTGVLFSQHTHPKSWYFPSRVPSSPLSSTRPIQEPSPASVHKSS